MFDIGLNEREEGYPLFMGGILSLVLEKV